MSELNLDKPSENLDYELISAYDTQGNEFWNVSFLRSPFEDVTIRYNNVQLDGKEGTLKFNFDVLENKDPGNTLDNLDMQKFHIDFLEYLKMLPLVQDDLYPIHYDSNHVCLM